jgi:hypothetical protein
MVQPRRRLRQLSTLRSQGQPSASAMVSTWRLSPVRRPRSAQTRGAPEGQTFPLVRPRIFPPQALKSGADTMRIRMRIRLHLRTARK